MSERTSAPSAGPDHASLAGLRALLAADFARVLRQTTGGRPVTGLRRLMHLSLPAMQVVGLHRLAHLLHGRGHRRAAARVASLSRALTGASFHPGARIGPGLFVPHPARVVFCGSAGHGLTVLPSALVGPEVFPAPWQPVPDDAPRLGDDAVVGAHAAVWGAVTVGDGAWVGIGVCTRRDVPAGTITMLPQRLARTPADPGTGDAV